MSKLVEAFTKTPNFLNPGLLMIELIDYQAKSASGLIIETDAEASELRAIKPVFGRVLSPGIDTEFLKGEVVMTGPNAVTVVEKLGPFRIAGSGKIAIISEESIMASWDNEEELNIAAEQVNSKL